MAATIDIKVVATDQPEYQQERILRNEVLLIPHGIPEFGWEQFDSVCQHIVATVSDKVIGCVLLKPHKEGAWGQLMQMAVNPEFQRQGVGYLLVEKLFDCAQSMKMKVVNCHARIDAVDFYSKNGFEIYDEPFWEVGIEHRRMKRDVGEGR